MARLTKTPMNGFRMSGFIANKLSSSPRSFVVAIRIGKDGAACLGGGSPELFGLVRSEVRRIFAKCRLFGSKRSSEHG